MKLSLLPFVLLRLEASSASHPQRIRSADRDIARAPARKATATTSGAPMGVGPDQESRQHLLEVGLYYYSMCRTAPSRLAACRSPTNSACRTSKPSKTRTARSSPKMDTVDASSVLILPSSTPSNFRILHGRDGILPRAQLGRCIRQDSRVLCCHPIRVEGSQHCGRPVYRQLAPNDYSGHHCHHHHHQQHRRRRCRHHHHR